MKLHLPKTRRYRVYLYILSIFLILIAIDLTLVRIGRHITVGYDTTRIISPLKPDGMPDYLKAVDEQCSAGVTLENNAAPLLLTAIGPGAFFNPTLDPIYSRLSMSPLPASGDYFQIYDQYLKSKGEKIPDPSRGEGPDDAARRHVWRAAENPLLAAWLESEAHPLSVLQDAVRRPRFFIPMTIPAGHAISLDDVLLPPLGTFRAIAGAAVARATLRAGEGDFDAARADLQAAHRLARLIAQGPTLIEFLVALAVDGETFDAERAIASAESFTPAQIRMLLADLDSLPPIADPARKLDTFARYAMLGSLVSAAAKRPSVALNLGDNNPVNIPCVGLVIDHTPTSFNTALRNANRFFDVQVDILAGATFAQRRAKIQACEEMFRHFSETLRGGGYLDSANFLLSLRMPSFTNISVYRDLHAMNFDLTRLALALAAYHADHHAYPAALAAISPEYLPTIPGDLFIDQPLHYRTTPTGYLLYSVGLNMTDDGGHGRGHKDPANPRADDIVVLVGEFPATQPK